MTAHFCLEGGRPSFAWAGVFQLSSRPRLRTRPGAPSCAFCAQGWVMGIISAPQGRGSLRNQREIPSGRRSWKSHPSKTEKRTWDTRPPSRAGCRDDLRISEGAGFADLLEERYRNDRNLLSTFWVVDNAIVDRIGGRECKSFADALHNYFQKVKTVLFPNEKDLSE